MNDEAIIFFSIVMIILFAYRIFLSIRLLNLKKYLIDEKFYIAFFYCSLVCVLVLFTNRIIVGLVLLVILPIILTLYVSLSKSRIYWIINGWEIAESTFVNKMIDYNDKYEDVYYRVNRFKFSKKKYESKTKIEFLNLDYEEKEKLLKIVKDILKDNTKKSNKNEIKNIIINAVLIFIFIWVIIFALFL